MFLRRHVWLLGVWRSGLRLRAPAVGVMDALVIPADPKEPVRVIDLHAGDDEVGNLQREVGGVFDVVAHRECDFWINDEGRINDSPVNVRASHWVLRESAMAKEGRVWEGAILYWGLCRHRPAPRRRGNGDRSGPRGVLQGPRTVEGRRGGLGCTQRAVESHGVARHRP